jgi:hypothetical protein
VAFVGRVFVIVLALVLATMTSGIAAAIGMLGLQFSAAAGDPLEHVFFWGMAMFASGVAAFVGFLPTLVGIAVAEAFYLRSFLIYAVAGAAFALIGYYGAGFGWSYEESIDHPPPPISREAEIVAAAGIVFGLTYWAIAGRRAGAWRGRP